MHHCLSYCQEKKPVKKQKKEKEEEKKAVSSTKKSEDEDTVWDLGNNRQVTVRNFKGSFYVDIREMYYDKDGDLKPGKKGNIIVIVKPTHQRMIHSHNSLERNKDFV